MSSNNLSFVILVLLERVVIFFPYWGTTYKEKVHCGMRDLFHHLRLLIDTFQDVHLQCLNYAMGEASPVKYAHNNKIIDHQRAPAAVAEAREHCCIRSLPLATLQY